MILPIDYTKSSSYIRRQAREQYVKEQKGLCWFCKESLDGLPAKKILKFKINKSLFPPMMFNHPVHLHHDHNTGLTIGAVHCYCNAVLWQYHGE